MKPERRKETAHARLDSNRGDGSPYPSLRDDLGKIYSGNLAPSTDSARYLSASSRRPGGASEGARSIYPLPCPGCCSCPSFDRSPPPSKRSSEKIHRCTRPWAFCLATTTTTCLPVPFSFFCFNISRFLESITPPPPFPPFHPPRLSFPFSRRLLDRSLVWARCAHTLLAAAVGSRHRPFCAAGFLLDDHSQSPRMDEDVLPAEPWPVNEVCRCRAPLSAVLGIMETDGYRFWSRLSTRPSSAWS